VPRLVVPAGGVVTVDGCVTGPRSVVVELPLLRPARIRRAAIVTAIRNAAGAR
jgi:hypothetical protein